MLKNYEVFLRWQNLLENAGFCNIALLSCTGA